MFNILRNLSNDLDRVRVAYYGLCLGLGGKIETLLRLKHMVLVHMQCALTNLWSVARGLAMH